MHHGLGRFCWTDLAASDAEAAASFYERMFGWTSSEQSANGGRFTRLRIGREEVASLYQLKRAQVDRGVPSHWTPYVAVADVREAARRVSSLGGKVIVTPFEVSGVARIALIEDAVGAFLGLWEAIEAAG